MNLCFPQAHQEDWNMTDSSIIEKWQTQSPQWQNGSCTRLSLPSETPSTGRWKWPWCRLSLRTSCHPLPSLSDRNGAATSPGWWQTSSKSTSDAKGSAEHSLAVVATFLVLKKISRQNLMNTTWHSCSKPSTSSDLVIQNRLIIPKKKTLYVSLP